MHVTVCRKMHSDECTGRCSRFCVRLSHCFVPTTTREVEWAKGCEMMLITGTNT